MERKTFPMERRKRIALLAHDDTNTDLVQWTKDNKRSGVRIPSAPLLKVLQKTGKSKDLGSPTGVLRTPVFTLVRYENASSMAATALCCMLGRTCRNKRR
jgi:hypothetical protein